jgi:protein ImuB
VQTLLGHGSVLTPVVSGGRSPAQRTQLVPWGDERIAVHSPEQPWPGRLPSPSPSVIIEPPRPVQVLDDTGNPVLVTERGSIPNPPARFAIDATPTKITAWAGPWPVDERWWDAESRQHLVRLQLVDAAGRAYLVCYTVTERRWFLEGIYD